MLHISSKVSIDDSWVQAHGYQVLLAQLLGQREGEEHVGSLGLPVGNPPIIDFTVLNSNHIVSLAAALPLSNCNGPMDIEVSISYIKIQILKPNMRVAIAVASHIDHADRHISSQHLR